MPKVKFQLVTSLSGAMRDTLFRTMATGNIVMSDKGKKPTFRYPEDEEARDSRANVFGGAGVLIPVVLDAARIGFCGRKRGQAAGTRFMAHNATTLCTSTVDEEGHLARKYDYRRMVLSDGRVDDAQVSAVVDTEAGTVALELTPQGASYNDNNCNVGDTVYVFVFDGERQKGRLLQLGTRGEGGSESFQIPGNWSRADLYVYAFVQSVDRTRASRTMLLYPTD